MIYEAAVVLRTDASEDATKNSVEEIKKTITDFGGEILVEDNWGVKTFGQPTHKGIKQGNYFYFMYKATSGEANLELQRRWKISEVVLKHLVIAAGEDSKQESLVKNYSNPSNSTDEAGRDLSKDRKMFSRRKSCWFSAQKTGPDWKDPNSYAWLVNEFGKISPARVTGLRPKYQRMATTAIKRGRCIGLISYISNHTAR